MKSSLFIIFLLVPHISCLFYRALRKKQRLLKKQKEKWSSSKFIFGPNCKAIAQDNKNIFINKCRFRFLMDCRNLPPMNDCLEHLNAGETISGIYKIKQNNITHDVLCDQETRGGGWTILQRRIDGNTDFFRNWKSYKEGFGNVQHNHWLGNDLIHKLTNQKHFENELLVVLRDWEDKLIHAKYSIFSLGNESSGYTLHVSGYNGTAGDGLKYHNGQQFSTKDRDHDNWPAQCARYCNGAWWYRKCLISNLNGEYYNQSNSNAGKGIAWLPYKPATYSMKYVEIKVRRKKRKRYPVFGKYWEFDDDEWGSNNLCEGFPQRE